MPRFKHRGSKKAGQAPGTPVYVGKEREAALFVSRYTYDEEAVRIDATGAVSQSLCAPLTTTACLPDS